MRRLKKYVRRARRTKRKIYRRKRMVKKQATTHLFKRSLFLPGILFSSSTASSFNSMVFSLNGVYFDASAGSANSALVGNYSLPSASEFTNLYEKYSIRKIVMKFYPRSSDAIGSATNQSAQYWNIVNDYNDSLTSFNQTDLLQMPKCRSLSSLRQQKHSIVPAVQNNLYNSLTTTSYRQVFKPWVDTSTGSGTPHYACKIFMPSTVSGASQKYDIQVVYYLAFRQPK